MSSSWRDHAGVCSPGWPAPPWPGSPFFALLHIKLLAWVIREHLRFNKTADYEDLRNSNAEVTLMALPLTLTMTINVFFIIGAVFVPGLRGIVEYLFPGALAGFVVTGFFALKSSRSTLSGCWLTAISTWTATATSPR